MRVTIWDLDYYYSKTKRNCFNTDAMRISSYHKQLGDEVTFVLTEFDIRRPFDLYYIIKEKQSTPNPPLDFFTNSRVRWWGAANRIRINWEMDRVMLGCRPDYLLYPEKNTKLERAEFIRLFDNYAKLIPIAQDYHNIFKWKDVTVVDKYMWQSSKKSLLKALDSLMDVKNVSFYEPIELKNLLGDEELKNKFLSLKLSNMSSMRFKPVNFDLADKAIEFIHTLQEKFTNISANELIIKYDAIEHWNNKDAALHDFNEIKRLVVKGRKLGVRVVAAALMHRIDTPYYHIFEELHNWTDKHEPISWFEYLTRVHHYSIINKPETWDEGFRDLIRQTYTDREFFLIKWKDRYTSDNEVPWELLDKEFKLGI